MMEGGGGLGRDELPSFSAPRALSYTAAGQMNISA